MSTSDRHQAASQRPAGQEPAARTRLRWPAGSGWPSRWQRTGMFGTGDHRRHLRLRRPPGPPGAAAAQPAALRLLLRRASPTRSARALSRSGTSFGDAIEQVVVGSGELTFYVRREQLLGGRAAAAGRARRWPSSCAWACPACTTPPTPGAELHAVYHLLSITHNRRIRLEVTRARRRPAHPVADRTSTPPATGTSGRPGTSSASIFDGHPALTRIEMPDDWRGHPQRKDYPLGGIPVEYRGATIPPPDERRSYE